ncbi:MAG: hypothetical protein HY865_22765 [Chloroflexi bacterium]|nr:hypothetical protein [Chloroflexota bacterium]
MFLLDDPGDARQKRVTCNQNSFPIEGAVGYRMNFNLTGSWGIQSVA